MTTKTTQMQESTDYNIQYPTNFFVEEELDIVLEDLPLYKEPLEFTEDQLREMYFNGSKKQAKLATYLLVKFFGYDHDQYEQ